MSIMVNCIAMAFLQIRSAAYTSPTGSQCVDAITSATTYPDIRSPPPMSRLGLSTY